MQTCRYTHPFLSVISQLIFCSHLNTLLTTITLCTWYYLMMIWNAPSSFFFISLSLICLQMIYCDNVLEKVALQFYFFFLFYMQVNLHLPSHLFLFINIPNIFYKLQTLFSAVFCCVVMLRTRKHDSTT